MQAKAWRSFALIVPVLLVVSGCGSKLVKVKGVLTLEGQPVQGAGVTFEKADGSGRPAVGQTDENGAFELTTFEQGDGAMPGDYRVLIRAPGNIPLVLEETPSSRRELGALEAQAKEEAKSKPLPFGANISRIYADPAKTPLKEHVPPDGPVNIALTSSAVDKSITTRRPPPSKGSKTSQLDGH